MPLDGEDTVSINAIHPVELSVEHSAILVLGLQFFQEAGQLDRYDDAGKSKLFGDRGCGLAVSLYVLVPG